MNYLAHAYLSFQQPGILVGNMISDFVKGRKKFDYPEDVQKGIYLHRVIDSFTDTHAVTKKAKQVFKPFAGLYAGAFMDVVYDHFLARDAQQFVPAGLAAFAAGTYHQLYSYTGILPAQFTAILPYMSRHDWLYNYSTVEGIEKSFAGVARRAAYLNSSTSVFKAFIDNYSSMQQYYAAFFPDVKKLARGELDKLLAA